jgi:hypothetical protein
LLWEGADTVTAPEKGLRFYPASHRYKLDGEWVPGVTTILGNAIPKPGLTKWAAKSVAAYVASNRETIEHLYGMGELPMVEALKNVPWQDRDEAANKGTAVHDFAERIINGEDVDVPEYLQGHVESCITFLETYDVRPVLVEACVGSRKHRYAGKLDLVAESTLGGPLSIMDYKTSRSGIYAETAYQLAAYAGAEFYGEGGDEHPMDALPITTAYGIHIRADGYDVLPLRFGPDVFNEWVTLVESSRAIARAQGNWKIPGTGYVGLPIEPEAVA